MWWKNLTSVSKPHCFCESREKRCSARRHDDVTVFIILHERISQMCIYTFRLILYFQQMPLSGYHHENIPLILWTLKPHFYIVKLGFTGVYIIFFFISAQKIDCGYSIEPPRRGGSNEYRQSMFWAEMWKIVEFFIWNLHFFLVVKFSVYLNRLVLVM